MNPEITYELKIRFTTDVQETKELVKSWLTINGHDTFVEGVIDGVDMEHDYFNHNRDMYVEAGGNESPLMLYDYSSEMLEQLKRELIENFPQELIVEVNSFDTHSWLEGWKDNFSEIRAGRFVIAPPWQELDLQPEHLSIVIEPGVAFGTGQHLTTQLCLLQMEKIAALQTHLDKQSFLDVGTGTGILSIAAKKLGYGEVKGTDIEADAIPNAYEHAQLNGVECEFMQTEVPSPHKGNSTFHKEYDVVVANILCVILEIIINDLAAVTKTNGHLIMCGLTKEQEESLMAKAMKAGFLLHDRVYQEPWVCLDLVKKVEECKE